VLACVRAVPSKTKLDGVRSTHRHRNSHQVMRASDRTGCRLLGRNADPDSDRKSAFGIPNCLLRSHEVARR
jgi:allophanate hydrolase subunit 2